MCVQFVMTALGLAQMSPPLGVSRDLPIARREDLDATGYVRKPDQRDRVTLTRILRRVDPRLPFGLNMGKNR